MTPFNSERYSRQIRFAALGSEGQQKLASAHVAIIGCGALGSFQAGAMARAGIGKLTLIDRDYVEVSNLQRQWLFDEADAEQGLPKAVAAARKLSAINSQCEVRPVVADLNPQNADDLLETADLYLDGTDNFETRYLLNDYAVLTSRPWVYGAAVGSYGLTMPVVPGVTACFACIYPEPPTGLQPTCETAGVLNPITSAIASLQCAEATRILAGAGPVPRITTIDIWSGIIRQVQQPGPDPECRACGRRELTWLDGRRRAPISLCGRDAVQIHERARPLDLRALERELGGLGQVRANEFALRFTVPPYEMTIFADGRAIIKGTTDVGVARSLYARYVGG